MNKVIGGLMAVASVGTGYLDATHLQGTTVVVEGFMALFVTIGLGCSIYVFSKGD